LKGLQSVERDSVDFLHGNALRLNVGRRRRSSISSRFMPVFCTLESSDDFQPASTFEFQNAVPPSVLKEAFGPALPKQVIQRSRAKPVPHDFNWMNCWYPIMFDEDVPENKPVRFKLFDEPRVLWRGKDGAIHCLVDICPHRGVPLSSGRIVDEGIECGYHGWTFNGGGQCTRIPQLPEGKSIPRRSCGKAFQVAIRQGIVWLWPDRSSFGVETDIPISKSLDDVDEFPVCNYTRDMPYDYSIQVENLLDVAHVHFTHHGFQGRRYNASHLVPTELIRTFKGNNRLPVLKASWSHENSQAPDIDMEFRGPCQVEVTIHHPPHGVGKNVIYITPTGDGQCRILFRNASNFGRPLFHLVPRWLRHFVVHSIADQDLLAILEQDQVLKPSDSSWRKVFFMPTSSDRLVLEFRKWFEQAAKTMPGREQSRSTKTRAFNSHVEARFLDRYSSHVAQCSSCRVAARNISILRRSLLALSFTGVSFAAIISHVVGMNLSEFWSLEAPLALALGCAIGNWILAEMEQRFYYCPQDAHINKRP